MIGDVRPVLVRFFSVLGRWRTYGYVLYAVLSLPLALAYLVLLGGSAVLGAALSIVGIGLFLLLGCLVAAWGFAILERALAMALLGVDIPPLILPSIETTSDWRRLRGHLSRPVTWKSLAFLVLKLPLGIMTATVTAILVAGPLMLMVAVVLVTFTMPTARRADLIPVGLVLGFGFVLLVAGLHLMGWIGQGWGVLARAMLSAGQEEVQLWEAQRRAEAADRSRRELILNVSHELRTPIASIRAHVDTLVLPPDQRPADADNERYLRVVSDEARRLGALVDDLLELARADADELAVVVRPVEVAALVRSAVAAAAPLARRERGVTVAHAEALPALRALADGDRLSQVLTNLVRNAVNNTPEGGAVYVQAGRVPPGCVFVEVSDTGHGIAPEDLERIFDRFYRTDPSRSRDSGGFGLGLSIARELAEAMGGWITASSEPDVGSTFRVTLREAE
jgi:signal transduction histidine kinase